MARLKNGGRYRIISRIWMASIQMPSVEQHQLQTVPASVWIRWQVCWASLGSTCLQSAFSVLPLAVLQVNHLWDLPTGHVKAIHISRNSQFARPMSGCSHERILAITESSYVGSPRTSASLLQVGKWQAFDICLSWHVPVLLSSWFTKSCCRHRCEQPEGRFLEWWRKVTEKT